MDIDWNAHRFSGGVLALDFINTVIYRDDPSRRLDRLSNLRQIDRFACAATKFRSSELGVDARFQHVSSAEGDILIDLRERADDYFRPFARRQDAKLTGLADLLAILASAVGDYGGHSFVHQLALSTLRHMGEPQVSKTRVCSNCHWLFLDRSKNGSRVWCDMSVCGNRHKARLNYRRQRIAKSLVEQ